VDLPTYTWNHSTSHWAEPRVSKTYSGRSHPRSDLLGVLVGNSNPLEPQWRNLIRPAEIPWVRDHQVQENVVYPAAGFIVMAIEAEYQRATERAVEVEGYKIRDFNIGQALVIPESSGEVEIMFSLRPYNESLRSPSDLWDEFCVFSVTGDNTWTEHCRGLISVQKHSKPSEVDGARHTDEENASHSRTIAEADASCLATVDTKALYESLKAIGLDYGPMFANMTHARASPNQCIATITAPDTGAGMPFKFQYPFLLHPATLDSCLHAMFPAIEAAQGPLQNPLIPTFIAELFVSQKIVNEPGHNLAVYAKSKKKDFRQTTGDLIIVDEGKEHPTPVMTLNGLVCINMARDSGEEADQNGEKLVYKVHWEPEIDLLSAEQILDFAKVEPPPEEVNEVRAVEKAAYFCMERALRLVPSDEIPNMHDHHKRLYECMNH
jgi:acyl transferase domain-containing protein